MTPEQIKLYILEEINELLAGGEKMVTQPDDPSGLYTEWVLDTEIFREKLQRRIDQLKGEVNG